MNKRNFHFIDAIGAISARKFSAISAIVGLFNALRRANCSAVWRRWTGFDLVINESDIIFIRFLCYRVVKFYPYRRISSSDPWKRRNYPFPLLSYSIIANSKFSIVFEVIMFFFFHPEAESFIIGSSSRRPRIRYLALIREETLRPRCRVNW